MIERVAKALHGYASVESWDAKSETDKDFWRGAARAAIGAMRVPTPEMVNAAKAVADATVHPDELDLGYRNMIDAALKP